MKYRDSAKAMAINTLYLSLGIETFSTIEHLEAFEEWIAQIQPLELACLIELLNSRLVSKMLPSQNN